MKKAPRDYNINGRVSTYCLLLNCKKLASFSVLCQTITLTVQMNFIPRSFIDVFTRDCDA